MGLLSPSSFHKLQCLTLPPAISNMIETILSFLFEFKVRQYRNQFFRLLTSKSGCCKQVHSRLSSWGREQGIGSLLPNCAMLFWGGGEARVNKNTLKFPTILSVAFFLVGFSLVAAYPWLVSRSSPKLFESVCSCLLEFTWRKRSMDFPSPQSCWLHTDHSFFFQLFWGIIDK